MAANAVGALPTTFRQLAETEKPFVLPGVHEGLSARLAEQAGFKGVFMGGFASLDVRHAVRGELPHALGIGWSGTAELHSVSCPYLPTKRGFRFSTKARAAS